MIPREDFLEATRRYKDKNTHLRERTRYHALLLDYKGYGYLQIADILMVDEDSVSRWMAAYRERGLDGLKNDPHWGGEHGQRRLSSLHLTQLGTLLEAEAMPGTEVGSGWSVRAIIDLVEERFSVRYSQRGMRKILRVMGWSWQRGRALYIKRTAEEQARFEVETSAILREFARSGRRCVPLAGDQTRVYLEGTIGKRWNPRGKQPRVADRSRTKFAENIYGAEHLGTGEEVAPFSIDFQDAGASVAWFEMVKAACPRGVILMWLDSAPHLTDEEVEDYLERQPRLRVIRFPKYTPEENPKEATWKALKAEVSTHRYHPTKQSLSDAIDVFYQTVKRHTVNFLERFGYFWENGRLHPMTQST